MKTTLRQRIIYIVVAFGLLQGLYAEYQARELWKDKVNLESIVQDGDTARMCHRLVEHGL